MMDVDEVVSLEARVAILEAKLDNANHILRLVVEALKNPNNRDDIHRDQDAYERAPRLPVLIKCWYSSK